MSQEIEQTAREMGWRPKEEFRGDPEKWVEASEFVSRGEHFLPIVKAENRRLKERLDETDRGLRETRELLAASQEAISALKEFHSADTKRQVEQARKALVEQLRTARENGDVEQEVAIQDQLAEVREAQAAASAPAPAPAPAAQPKPQEAPEFVAWKAANPWFVEKPRLRGMALGIAEELRAAHPNLTGAAFFDKVTEEMKPYLAPETPTASKVGNGRSGSSSGDGGSQRARTFNDLPKEAREVCERQATKLVGKGRAFATAAEWQAHYVTQYFAGETA